MNKVQVLAQLSLRATDPVRVLVVLMVALTCSQGRCQEKKDQAEAGISFRIVHGSGGVGFQAGPTTSPDSKIGVKVSGMTAQLYDKGTGKNVGEPLKLTNRIYYAGENNTEEQAQKAGKRITAWAFSPDWKTIAIGGSIGKPPDANGEVLVWDVATQKLLASVEITTEAGQDIGYVWALAFTADGNTVIVRCEHLSGR
jgi:hypothetical protein